MQQAVPSNNGQVELLCLTFGEQSRDYSGFGPACFLQ